MARPFRILSLDGGGPWSLIQARTLGRIFGPDMPGRELLAHFDFVTCNSGGAVVVAGLLANMTPGSVESNCFINPDRLHEIFRKPTFRQHPLAVMLRPLRSVLPTFYEYRTAAKFAALRDVLGEVADLPIPRLPSLFQDGTAAPKFLFTAFGYDRLREQHFRSDVSSPAASDSRDVPLTLAEAVHASSTAPLLYFDAPAVIGSGTGTLRFWDGGVGGYNNPVLQGVAEAMAYGVPRESIRVISIGSGTIVRPVASEFPNADPSLVNPTPGYCLRRDLQKIGGAILDDPPDAASLHAYMLLGRPLPARQGGLVQPQATEGFVRLNPMIRPHLIDGAWKPPVSFPDPAWTMLCNLELICIEPKQIEMLQQLTACWMASNPLDIPNQPVRLTWPDFTCELGHASFADALAAARDMY